MPTIVRILTFMSRINLSQVGKKLILYLFICILGKAFDYVLLTTVRWCPASKIDRVPSIPWKRRRLGDLLEKGFVTMAMTRARKGLVIVGEFAKLKDICY